MVGSFSPNFPPLLVLVVGGVSSSSSAGRNSIIGKSALSSTKAIVGPDWDTVERTSRTIDSCLNQWNARIPK
uniref:Putative secreted protein n=1 Tax=Anopheles darlingi TaxID=43151 RepID=A0A2M4DLH3_ANODA